MFVWIDQQNHSIFPSQNIANCLFQGDLLKLKNCSCGSFHSEAINIFHCCFALFAIVNFVFLKIADEKISLLPDVSAEDPDFVRERSPSPAKNAPSTILSIRNLVRPFTLRQLREFLSKTGTVVDDGFWIDRIKSHCYVTVRTSIYFYFKSS